jgi:hypothetical protein
MRRQAAGWVGLAMMGVASAAAEEVPGTTASPAPGIYVELEPPASPAAASPAGLDRVAANRPTRTGVKDVAKSMVKGMLTGGMLGGGPKMVLVFAGARASERLTAQPMFQFHFDPGASSSGPARPDDVASMMAMMATMESGSEMPAGVIRPQEFALVRLESKGDERELEASSDMKPSKKHTVACRVRQLGPHVFRVAPEQPLPPGEYGFVAVPKGGGVDRLWDFGVD